MEFSNRERLGRGSDRPLVRGSRPPIMKVEFNFILA